MAEFVCKECGAANPPDARFCGGCDAYLGWDTNPPQSSRRDKDNQVGRRSRQRDQVRRR